MNTEEVRPEAQYSEPRDDCKLWISSYARHVAHTYPHEEKPDLKVTGVKVYRAIHRMYLTQPQFVDDLDPNDLTTYSVFYYGDFDAEGQMKKSCVDVEILPSGELKLKSRDPFLYWLIPIVRVPTTMEDKGQERGFKHKGILTGRLRNYVRKHAGDPEDEEEEGLP
jgi:hypothetical protein